MAAPVGLARRIGSAGIGYLFPTLRASVPARVASVPGQRCRDARAACATAHGCAIYHGWHPFLRSGRAQSGGAALNSALGGGVVIWRPLRVGLDVDPASQP